MKAIIVILAFSLLSSVTFSQNARGGWVGEIRHDGVNVHGDTIHVNYGEVVEIWFHEISMGNPPPPFLFNWYLDDVLVPLEAFGGYFHRRYELNQPGIWEYRLGPGSWSKWVVVVWDYEYLPEVFDPDEGLNPEIEKQVHRENAMAPNTDDIVPPNTVDIIPNPTRDRIKLVSSSKLTQLNILNQSGVIVYSSSPGTNETVVDLNHLARGIYFAQTISEHGERTMERILIMD